jgi:hypothetical protein
MSALATFAAALGILGGILTAYRRPLAGHIVWCAANPLWIAWAASAGQPAVAAQASVFLALAAVGVWRWWGWRAEDRKWREVTP